jgi:transposase InsO family protein
MTAELNARGYDGTENTVAPLTKAHGIRARAARRFVRTTDSRHSLPAADNRLGRDFDPGRPDAAWSADLTYIPTADGWLYLAVVEGLFSRMIVGWSMGETMASRLVVDALEMAVRRRLPEGGLLAHSDRGSQYASEHYQRLLGQHGIPCSMSRVAQCWGNAPVESFLASLKRELVHHERSTTREQAKARLFEYVEAFDNRVRRHSSLGYVSPEAFERTHNPNHP